MTADEAAQAKKDLLACPVLTERPDVLDRQARRDALRLAADVREIDPAELWGRLAWWDPRRVWAAAILLAATVDPETSQDRALAWCNEFGGTQALQPYVRRLRGAA
jgi:hypothetical protein